MIFRTFTFIEWRKDIPLRHDALAAAADMPITYWLDDELVLGRIVRIERWLKILPTICVSYELEKCSPGVLSLDVMCDGVILRAAYIPAMRALRVVA